MMNKEMEDDEFIWRRRRRRRRRGRREGEGKILSSFSVLALATALLASHFGASAEDPTAATSGLVPSKDLHEMLGCCQDGPVKEDRATVRLGYLTAVMGNMRNRQGRAISGALSYAVEQVNTCSCLLPDVKLEFTYNDTKGLEPVATAAIVDLICNDIAAFIGPEGPNCHTEAMVAGSKNRAMISYRCSDAEISGKDKYPTFTRMEPPDTQITNSVLSLLAFYKWDKFSIIFQEGAKWETISKFLNEQALLKDFHVNHYVKFADQNKCCLHEAECCNTMWPHSILKETKDKTRIYVFVGEPKMLLRFMNQMKVEQLFADGEYMVVYLFPDTADYDDLGFFLWDLDSVSSTQSRRCEEMGQASLQQWRSLIVVSGSPYRVDTSEFANMVRTYNQLPPFNFKKPAFDIFQMKFNIHISIYAAHLYDSVMLFARALHTRIEEAKRLAGVSTPDVDALARDGRAITDAIKKMGGYDSISGNFVRIDENGDSEGNFTAFALREHNYTRVSRITGKTMFSCSYYPVKVGEFQSISAGNGSQSTNITYTPKYNIDWPGPHKPAAEPHCGYEDERCPRAQGRTEIATGILGALLLMAILLTLSCYRKMKVEQEIEGLLWKINPDCLQGYRGLQAYPSKQSVGSGMSGDSRGVYPSPLCQAAKYRGYFVRINVLKYEKKKDIPRDVMKEMKLMRELRHDNVNSFIGACVESTCITLITDFCSKGALQDILENTDIKLEPMFLSSFIFDIIKGLQFLHSTDIGPHGNLRSSNVVVTSRWTLQVTDFGLHELRRAPDRIRDEDDEESDEEEDTHILPEDDEDGHLSKALVRQRQQARDDRAKAKAETDAYKLLWRAPELIRNSSSPVGGTAKGDIYAFGVIMYEIFGRSGPYGELRDGLTYQEIIRRVCSPEGIELMRPDLEQLEEREEDSDYNVPNCVIDVMRDCWSEFPESRPDLGTIRNRLKVMKQGMKANIMDQMVEMLEKYSNNLEDLVLERTRQLYEEKQKTEDLIHRMLPRTVARKLTQGFAVEPESYTGCTIYFSDIVGFTSMCSESTPLQVVNFLNELYTKFDEIIQSFDVYKVETIGDAYMVVSGLPERTDEHAGQIASLSLELLDAVKNFTISHRPTDTLRLRIGVHTGPVVAGVVGLAMPRYCLFGDTVNTAARYESTGEPLRIHISDDCNRELTRLGGYVTESRGLIEMKGKGKMPTHWLLRSTSDCPIRKKGGDQHSKLKPFFRQPRNLQQGAGGAAGQGGVPNTPEFRRRSPRMSMASALGGPDATRASGIIRQSGGGAPGGDRHTPDSVRNSLVQLATTQLQQQKQHPPHQSGSAAGSRTGTPPVEKEADVFRKFMQQRPSLVYLSNAD